MTKSSAISIFFAICAIAVASLVFAQFYGPGRFEIVHIYESSADSCVDREDSTDRLYADKDCDGTKDAGEEYIDTASFDFCGEIVGDGTDTNCVLTIDLAGTDQMITVVPDATDETFDALIWSALFQASFLSSQRMTLEAGSVTDSIIPSIRVTDSDDKDARLGVGGGGAGWLHWLGDSDALALYTGSAADLNAVAPSVAYTMICEQAVSDASAYCGIQEATYRADTFDPEYSWDVEGEMRGQGGVRVGDNTDQEICYTFDQLTADATICAASGGASIKVPHPTTIVSTTADQLSVQYDGTNKLDFDVDSDGNAYIDAPAATEMVWSIGGTSEAFALFDTPIFVFNVPGGLFSTTTPQWTVARSLGGKAYTVSVDTAGNVTFTGDTGDDYNFTQAIVHAVAGMKAGASPTAYITETHCGNVSIDFGDIAEAASATASAAVTNLSANAACICSPRSDWDDDVITKHCYATSGNLNVTVYHADDDGGTSSGDLAAVTVDYCCFEK